jgi:hypothetical protein
MKFTRFAFAALALALATPALLIGQYDHPSDHDRGGWDAPPPEFREIQRQGFHDGLAAGRYDFENHIEPKPEWRREFRDPPVPPPARDEYRDGFRHGYNAAFSHFHDDHDRH